VVKNIIFLVYWPITSREEKQYGFDILKKRGFNVQVCDVTELCNGLALQRNPVPNALTDGYIYKCSSFDKLEAFLEETSYNSIYIDYMRGINDLDSTTEKVFRLLYKYNVKYFTLVTGTLPTPVAELNSIGRYRWFLSKLVSHPTRLYGYLIRIVIAYLRRRRVLYPLPTRIFATDNSQVKQFLLKNNLKESVVVKMHSPDYYDFLQITSKLRDASEGIQEPYCIFIDEGMVGHADIDICGIKRLNAQSYSDEINKILKHIECNYKMTVIVAAHPRSNLETLKNVYPGKKIIQGETLQLIVGSEFVMAHLSSVVGYAALLKKSIILIETAEMRKTDYYHAVVHTMANALGLDPFQTDLEELENFDKYRYCSMDKYDQYVAQYVKTSGASDESMWDIVAQEAATEIK